MFNIDTCKEEAAYLALFVAVLTSGWLCGFVGLRRGVDGHLVGGAGRGLDAFSHLVLHGATSLGLHVALEMGEGAVHIPEACHRVPGCHGRLGGFDHLLHKIAIFEKLVTHSDRKVSWGINIFEPVQISPTTFNIATVCSDLQQLVLTSKRNS